MIRNSAIHQSCCRSKCEKEARDNNVFSFVFFSEISTHFFFFLFFNHLCDFHVYLCMAFSFLLLSFSTEIISSLRCRTGTLERLCTTSQKHINSGFCSCPSHHVPQACASNLFPFLFT